jgi:hypothetical protein
MATMPEPLASVRERWVDPMASQSPIPLTRLERAACLREQRIHVRDTCTPPPLHASLLASLSVGRASSVELELSKALMRRQPGDPLPRPARTNGRRRQRQRARRPPGSTSSSAAAGRPSTASSAFSISTRASSASSSAAMQPRQRRPTRAELELKAKVEQYVGYLDACCGARGRRPTAPAHISVTLELGWAVCAAAACVLVPVCRLARLERPTRGCAHCASLQAAR